MSSADLKFESILFVLSSHACFVSLTAFWALFVNLSSLDQP